MSFPKVASVPGFLGGRRSDFDSCSWSLDDWDPCEDSPSSSPSSSALSSSTGKETSAFDPIRVEWQETPQSCEIRADLPRIRKVEVKAENENGNILWISGERNVKKEVKYGTWHRVVPSSLEFMQIFTLPENAKMDQVKASLENDVLTVTVPKEGIKQKNLSLYPF